MAFGTILGILTRFVVGIVAGRKVHLMTADTLTRCTSVLAVNVALRA